LVKAEQRNFLRLARFLVINRRLFPKDDGAEFLTLAHVSTKLQRLPEREPEQ
jgi:hypothetical protein